MLFTKKLHFLLSVMIVAFFQIVSLTPSAKSLQCAPGDTVRAWGDRLDRHTPSHTTQYTTSAAGSAPFLSGSDVHVHTQVV